MRGEGIIGLALVALLALAVLAGAGVIKLPGAPSLHQATTEIEATQEENAGGTGQVQIKSTTTAEAWTIEKVRMFFVSALDPRKPVGGFTVEFLPPEANPADPMRNVLDSAEVNSTTGEAVFEKGVLVIGKQYKLVVRGDTIVYDREIPIKVPILPPEKTVWTYPDKIHVMPVGAFADINVDTAKDVEWNISGESGINYRTITIRIAVSDATPEGAIKEPVLVFRTPEDAPLDTAAIVHIYASRLQGTDFGIPPVDLAGYFASETPIPLKGSYVWDADGAVYMTAADSAVYEIKIGYDADSIQNGQKLIIALDDLGGYNKGDITNNKKAAPEVLTITFVK